MFSRLMMLLRSDWFLWLLTTMAMASLPVLINVVVWCVLRGLQPYFPLFRAEDLAYYSLILISTFTLRIRKLDTSLVTLLLIMTVFCAIPLGFLRHAAIMPNANGPSEPGFEAVQVGDRWEAPATPPNGPFGSGFQTAQPVLISAAVVTLLAALLSARQRLVRPRPPGLQLWGLRLVWALLPCLMNVYWHLSAVRCQILTIDGLSFFSIALAAQGILDVTASSRSWRMRAASSVPLILVAVLASTVLGLWYFTELPLQETASESLIPALTLTSRIVAALSLSAGLVVEVELT